MSFLATLHYNTHAPNCLNRDGHDVLGYDKNGYNKAGFDAEGYNK